MKDFDRFIKLSLRCGLLTIIVIAGNFGCANPSISQTAHPSATALQPIFTISIQPTEVPSTPALNIFDQATETPLKDVVREMLKQVNKDRALTDLRTLTGEQPICNDNGCYTISNRLTSSIGLQKVKNYIINGLVKLGYSVEEHNWSRSGYADQNLIVKKMGVSIPDEEVYFVAHMDGEKKGLGKNFPAANDDASGVVDLLELARIISSHSFSRTLVLFFPTGEEQGSLGVIDYLKRITPEELSSIKYVVDVDMVGYDANGDSVMELWYGDDAPSLVLVEMMSETIKANQIDLAPRFTVGCG